MNDQKQSPVLESFLQQIDKLKNKEITPENIKKFARDIETIGKKLENSELSEEEFSIAEEKLLNFVEFLREESLNKEIDEKIKKRKIITPEVKEVKMPEPVMSPITVKETRNIEPIKEEIVKPDMLEFKRELDKRLKDLKEIKTQYSNNEVFEYFVDELNKIIEETVFAFEDTDLKSLYNDLKGLEQNLILVRDNLNNEEYVTLKREINKLEKYLQSLLLEKGAKFKQKGIKLKEESIKGRVKKFIKEQKFEGIGGLVMAFTDSPLMMILGKQIDEAIENKREKKKELQDKQLEKLVDIYKNKKRNSKGRYKVRESRKEEKEIPFPIPMMPKVEAGEDDEEYKRMLSDLKMFGEESAKELGLSEENKQEMASELEKLQPVKFKNERSIQERERIIPEEERNIKRENIFDKQDEDLYELFEKHIPSIDENIKKLTKSYTATNEEQAVNDRDRVLENISKNLEVRTETTKEESRTETTKSIKNLIPHIGMIGKVLSGVGAFSIGWTIGKELDRLFKLTPKIQKAVDTVQVNLDTFIKHSEMKTMSKEQRGKARGMESLKEKLGTERMTGENLYWTIKDNKDILKTLNEEERKFVLKKIQIYESAVTKKENKTEKPQMKNIIPTINKTENKEIDNTKKDVNISSLITNNPIVNKSYENLKTENIKRFETEKSDNITNITKKSGNKEIDNTKNITNVSLGRNVDLTGLQPEVKENLFSMANEYNEKTGKILPINSAYRSTEDQERLYKEMPGRAARPGTSMHEKGLAVDINSPVVNELKTTGLLKKYDFETPVKRETWHIEPSSVRTAYLNNQKQKTINNSNQIGDAVNVARGNNRINNYSKEANTNNNSNTVFSESNSFIVPTDFRSFIDDPFLFNEFRNDYS